MAVSISRTIKTRPMTASLRPKKTRNIRRPSLYLAGVFIDPGSYFRCHMHHPPGLFRGRTL